MSGELHDKSAPKRPYRVSNHVPGVDVEMVCTCCVKPQRPDEDGSRTSSSVVRRDRDDVGLVKETGGRFSSTTVGKLDG